MQNKELLCLSWFARGLPGWAAMYVILLLLALLRNTNTSFHRRLEQQQPPSLPTRVLSRQISRIASRQLYVLHSGRLQIDTV
jgi:hypothetical protein